MRKRYELITDASSPVRKWVAYERCEWESTSDCAILIKCYLVVLTPYSTIFFILSTINWVNKTTNKKEINKNLCDSVNHTRFPKEDHPPDLVRRDNKVTQGDRVHYVPFALW